MAPVIPAKIGLDVAPRTKFPREAGVQLQVAVCVEDEPVVERLVQPAILLPAAVKETLDSTLRIAVIKIGVL